MAGFTVSNSNRFLDTGSIDAQSMRIDNGSTSSATSVGKSFSDTLSEAIGNVNELHKVSDKKAEMLATGKTDDVADVMIAAEKADIALKVMVQVRNKVIDAYNEIMKMQV